MDLPAGTVTFLFTDVESSTRLLQAHPRGYAAAIARHHELLAAAVQDAGGVVFETVGDAVYAAFSDPVAAVRAAVDGQRALAAEPRPEIGALRWPAELRASLSQAWRRFGRRPRPGRSDRSPPRARELLGARV